MMSPTFSFFESDPRAVITNRDVHFHMCTNNNRNNNVIPISESETCSGDEGTHFKRVHIRKRTMRALCFNYTLGSRGIIHVHVRCSTISSHYTPPSNCTRSRSRNAFGRSCTMGDLARAGPIHTYVYHIFDHK